MSGKEAKRTTRSSTADVPENIRDEVRKLLDVKGELVNVLVEKIKTTLINELTDVIAKKVTEIMKENHEFDLSERDKKITVLQKELDDIKHQQDEMEQYSRRNCLIFHGLTEREGENTDEVVRGVCKDKLGIDIDDSDLDRTHRLGPVKGGPKPKPRGVIVKFTNYNIRNRVYMGRRKLRDQRGPQIYIQESLTKARTDLFWEVKTTRKDDIKSVWTQDGRIKVLTKDDHRVTLTNKSHLKRIKPSSFSA